MSGPEYAARLREVEADLAILQSWRKRALEEIEQLKMERDASRPTAEGLRSALASIRLAVSILDAEKWEAMEPERFRFMVARAFSVLVNAEEMARACFVASVPREPEAEPEPRARSSRGGGGER